MVCPFERFSYLKRADFFPWVTVAQTVAQTITMTATVTSMEQVTTTATVTTMEAVTMTTMQLVTTTESVGHPPLRILISPHLTRDFRFALAQPPSLPSCRA